MEKPFKYIGMPCISKGSSFSTRLGLSVFSLLSIHTVSHMHFDAKEWCWFKYDRLLSLGLQQRWFVCLTVCLAGRV